MTTFIHLRVHSDYSLLKAANKITKLVDMAVENSMPALALTDDNLFGALEFAECAAKAGIQPIIGCNLILKYLDINANIILLAKNKLGFKNLIKLSEFISQHELNLEKILACQEGLILLSGNLLEIAIKQVFDINKLLLIIKEYFGSDFYIELNRIRREPLETQILELAYKYEIPLVATNAILFPTADFIESYNILTCIADGTYLNSPDRKAVSEQCYFKPAQEMQELFSDLKEAVENTVIIAKKCSFMPEGLAPILPKYLRHNGETNGNNSNNYNNYSYEEDNKENEEDKELRKQALYGLGKRLLKTHEFSSLAAFEIKNLQELEKRLPPEYVKRLEYELEIIINMKYSGYFLIVSDFINWSKEHNIPVGPGRGSGVGSIVAWSLNITELNPLKFGLLFERFLNPVRVSLPDFDIDFCQEKRPLVIEYIRKKYGHVAQIVTFGSLQPRAALRDVGRVLQIPYGRVDKICKMIPHNPANPITLTEAIAIDPGLQTERDNDEIIKKLLDNALKLEGLYRHASTHAAGIVISDQPITDFVPVYYEKGSDIPITQYPMKYVEKAGLIKFDFLGLKTLTMIHKACELITESQIREKQYPTASFYKAEHSNNSFEETTLLTSPQEIKTEITNAAFDIASISMEDEKTYKFLAEGKSVGVFQLENSFMCEVLKKLKPDNIEDIIALVSLNRPGPMSNIPAYINRKHNREKINYPHPLLENVLGETFGIIIYQEQVMEVARILSGYSLAEADILRRAMGKKIRQEMKEQKEKFVKGAVQNNIQEEKAEEIFDLVEKFAGYGFNKSHAAAYALIAYQTAYLKANFPLEFFTATLNLEINHTDKLAIFINEAKRCNITILPPHINESEAYFKIEGNAIRYSLAALKNVGEGAAQLLTIAEANNSNNNILLKKLKKFNNIQEFAEKIHKVENKEPINIASNINNVSSNSNNHINNVKDSGNIGANNNGSNNSNKLINKRTIESLIKSGALDSLHENRAALIASVEKFLNYKNNNNSNNQQANFGLSQALLFFGDIDEGSLINENIISWNFLVKSQNEFEAIGFFLNNHPLKIYQNLLRLPPSKLAGVITHIKIRSRGPRKFAVLQLSAIDNIHPIIFYESEIIERKTDLFTVGSEVIMDVMKGENGLTGKDIASLEDFILKSLNNRIVIQIEREDQLHSLKKVLRKDDNSKMQIIILTCKKQQPLEQEEQSEKYSRIALLGTYSFSLKEVLLIPEIKCFK